MTLVADRFVRFDDGTVRDLATGERVTLIETSLTSAAEQVARRDHCLGRLDAPLVESLTLVDFGLVGESRWIEAWGTTSEVMTPELSTPESSTPREREGIATFVPAARPSRESRDEGHDVITRPVVDAIAATLDSLGSRDVHRLYVKAPDGARLEAFQGVVAREVRARGFIPLSASVVGDTPAIAPLLASRAIVLFGDARCAFGSFRGLDSFQADMDLLRIHRASGAASAPQQTFDSFSNLAASGAIARAIALLHRAAGVVAAVVARVCDHVNVAALRLMLASTASARRAALVLPGLPQSAVQPAAPVSYADPDLPTLFPRTDRIAHVAETAGLASFAFDSSGYDARALWSADIPADQRHDAVRDERDEAGTEPGALPSRRDSAEGERANGFEPARGLETARSGETVRGGEAEPGSAAGSDRETRPDVEALVRYPPLRLVERRSRSKPAGSATQRAMQGGVELSEGPAAERAAIDIPVVTTMVSGYGEEVDGLVGRGRWAAASRALRAEVAAFERRKRWYEAARTSIALGRLHLAMCEVGPAARSFDRAGELASARGPDGDLGSAARGGTTRGGIARDGADNGGGDRDSDACDSRVDCGGARLIGEALRWSGVAALDDGELERSERLLRSALAAIGPEADPFQVFAIELSLARCLFWQGRAREIVLPAADAMPLGITLPSDVTSSSGIMRPSGILTSGIARPPGIVRPSDIQGMAARVALEAAILRVERWRRAARIALVDGDLSAAGDAIARACRIARGEDEHEVRGGGCRIERSERRQAPVSPRSRGRHDEEHGRVFEALRAACHLDAARLQFAIGDTASGDVHLRESLALSRAPARTARLQLLQLVRFKNTRTSEARRRFERLAAALRQPRVPRLVRIQARYLIDPRSQRARGVSHESGGGASSHRGAGPRELVTFLDRHGDTALAGYGHPDRRGGSPMIEAFQDVLRICHETPDDLTALARVSAYVRDQLRALSVAIYGVAAPANIVAPDLPDLVFQEPFDADQHAESASPGVGPVVVRYAVAGSTRILSPGLAMRAIDSGLAIPPTYRPDALDAAAPVRYGGATIGALVVRWSIDAALDQTHTSALISAAAAAVSPHLRAALDREYDASAAVADDAASAAGTASHAGGAGARASAAGSGGAAGAARAADVARTAGAAGAAGATGAAGAGSRSSVRTLGLLGISSAIETLRNTITRVSSAPFHVLIEGESGSGKELVARALHQHGPRRHRRFCAVNCAAFSDELLEAELFGHTRGAFTGALTERAGLFEEADGGTLFLDEIGELSPRGQAKLLRVIQDGETRRIGENLPRRVDTRIVAATNRSLRDEAGAGRFREDLLYRLDVIRIMVPPLRDRPEDVAVLARAFWDDAIARVGSRATLDPAALAALARYHWPGNVRELHNAIMALAVHAPRRGRVTSSLLPASIRARPGAAATASRSEREPLPFEGRLEDARRAFESRYIRAALARAGGSPSRAARDLGLTRQGLKKLMTRLDVLTARNPCE